MQTDIKILIRDTAIILGLTFLSGFVIGLASHGVDNTSALAISNLIFTTLGFFIVGCMTKVSRFRHLAKVALIVWLAGSINILLGATPAQWALSIVVVFVTMGIGGGLSFLAVKAPKEDEL